MPATTKSKSAAAKPAPKPAATKPTTATTKAASQNGSTDTKAALGQVTGTLSFAAAPPKAKRGGSGRSHNWGGVIDQLTANPGQWAVLGVYTSAGNRPKALKDAGITMKTSRVREADGSFAEAEDGSALFELWGSFEPNED